ncbi:hypothetical protein CH328_02430 [Mycoplasmopsis bovis]|nr:hypothetical protein CH328_02430 [Mycoplasmopsis bovis]
MFLSSLNKSPTVFGILGVWLLVVSFWIGSISDGLVPEPCCELVPEPCSDGLDPEPCCELVPEPCSDGLVPEPCSDGLFVSDGLDPEPCSDDLVAPHEAATSGIASEIAETADISNLLMLFIFFLYFYWFINLQCGNALFSHFFN